MAGVNAGTTTDPQVNRTGLTLANLSNTFYLGSVNTINSPLPIGLVSFTAVVTGGQVKLDWATATETNNDYFTVQRSKDGVQWDSLERVAGSSGNGNAASLYTAYDPAPYTGISFYRLQQTDLDGKQTYSAICTVNIQNSFSNINIFPDPATTNIAITFPAAGKYEVRLFNTAGHMINNPVLGSGANVNINVSNIPSGVYIVTINYEDHTETKEVVVLK